MSQYVLPDPVVQVAGARELAPDVVMIPDGGVDPVPSIGLIGGADAPLVVDTGIGPRNAEEVRALMVERYPDWSGRERLQQSVECFAERVA